MIRQQSGFTLIELIMVIVILGALAVVAIPRYADLQSEAEEAAADGVYGAAEAAVAINFAAGLTGATQPAGGPITTGAQLLLAMEITDPDWVDGTTDVNQICLDADADANCGAGDTYIITVTTDETLGTSKAVLTKGW